MIITMSPKKKKFSVVGRPNVNAHSGPKRESSALSSERSVRAMILQWDTLYFQ